MRETQKELVLRLQQLRVEKRLSYQDLVNLCEQHGEPLSLSSVKRVFAKGGENGDYRYETTLRPLVHVLCEQDDDANMEVAVSRADALQAVVDLKTVMLEKLRAEVEAKNADLEWHRKALRMSKLTERAMIAAVVLLSLLCLCLVNYFMFFAN